MRVDVTSARRDFDIVVEGYQDIIGYACAGQECRSNH